MTGYFSKRIALCLITVISAFLEPAIIDHYRINLPGATVPPYDCVEG
jgi:hypothetical protein